MGKTTISWTDFSWNPITGCSKVSEGCRHCFAERLARQRGWSTLPWTAANAAENIVLHADRLNQPARLKQPHMIFVNSMSDMFHPRIDRTFLQQVWNVIRRTPQHTYQILTKRPEAIQERLPQDWGGGWPNVWLGVSAEDAKNAARRIPALLTVPAAIRFVSLEPLLGPIEPKWLAGLDWVIVGGESGPVHRSMDMSWARAIRDGCQERGIPLFIKQDSDYLPGQRSYLVEEDGTQVEYHEYPTMARPPEQKPLF